MQPVTEEQLRAVWAALASGKPAPLGIGADAMPAADGGTSPDAADSALALTARVEKQVKQRLTVAADHFNRDYRKGFQYLQVHHLLPMCRAGRKGLLWCIGQCNQMRMLAPMSVQLKCSTGDEFLLQCCL